MNKIIYVLLESCVASTTVLYRWTKDKTGYFCATFFFVYFYSLADTVKCAVLFILKCVAVEGNRVNYILNI